MNSSEWNRTVEKCLSKKHQNIKIVIAIVFQTHSAGNLWFYDLLRFTCWLWWFNSTQFFSAGCSKNSILDPKFYWIWYKRFNKNSFDAMTSWCRFNSWDSFTFLQFIHQIYLPNILSEAKVKGCHISPMS